MDYRDVVERAAWTAVQAFLSVLVLTDVASIEAALVAAGGALISAVKTVAAARLAE
jgi:hypothetical protein